MKPMVQRGKPCQTGWGTSWPYLQGKERRYAGRFPNQYAGEVSPGKAGGLGGDGRKGACLGGYTSPPSFSRQRYQEATLLRGAQTLARFMALGRGRAFLQSVQHSDSLLEPEIAGSKDVQPAKVEEKEHLGGPLPDSPDRRELFLHFIIGQLGKAPELQLSRFGLFGQVPDGLQFAS